jgi:hypothetical protein
MDEVTLSTTPGVLPDVTECRLLDLLHSNDPMLVAAVADLVAELPDPVETTSGWPNFAEPFDHTNSLRRSSAD